MPENFVVPAWDPPTENALAVALPFTRALLKQMQTKRPPIPISKIETVSDNDGEGDMDVDERDGDFVQEPEARRPTPSYAPHPYSLCHG